MCYHLATPATVLLRSGRFGWIILVIIADLFFYQNNQFIQSVVRKLLSHSPSDGLVRAWVLEALEEHTLAIIICDVRMARRLFRQSKRKRRNTFRVSWFL